MNVTSMFRIPSMIDDNAVRKFSSWVRSETLVKAQIVAEGIVFDEVVGKAGFIEPRQSLFTLLRGARDPRTFNLQGCDFTILEKRIVATTDGWNCVIFDDVSEG